MSKIEFKKKLVIGSANFAQKYGADPIEIKNKQIKKILKIAKENNINFIDTAETYLKNKDIFKKIDKRFKFITKIKPDFRWVSLDFCQKKLQTHFKKFNKNKIETLLFHDINILLGKNGPIIFKNIKKFKKKYFKKIGISIYETKNLNYLINNYNIDVVQCPFNILDKRIVNSGWLKKLRGKGIEIHARSIFLQGLLVNTSVYKKKYFKKWQKLFFKWFQDLEVNNISAIDYCLSDLINYDFDRIIIGVNNYNDLNEIINFKKIKKNNKIINLKISDTKLIDPRKWN